MKHGTWPNAFAYRFTTPDKVIVISGDAAYDPKMEVMAQGVDILIHEVVSEQALSLRTPFWQDYHRSNHTTSYELAGLARLEQTQAADLISRLGFWFRGRSGLGRGSRTLRRKRHPGERSGHF